MDSKDACRAALTGVALVIVVGAGLAACDRGHSGEGSAEPGIGNCAVDPVYDEIEVLEDGNVTHVNGFIGRIQHDRSGGGTVTALAMALSREGDRPAYALRSISSRAEVTLHQLDLVVDGRTITPSERCEWTPGRDVIACFFREADLIRLATACEATVRLETDEGEPFEFELTEADRANVQGVLDRSLALIE